MLSPGKRNYILLSIFDFLYLFAWSATMAFFVIWTTQHLGISATQTGLLFSINAFIALLMQPFFGFISDKFGLKKKLIWLLVALLLPVGPFFIYIYAPLLKHNFWTGAVLGGIYLGIIFNSGSGVIDSYIDKISRRYRFEYGRVRMWGSLGWAAAAWIVGRYIDSIPNLSFWLASCAIVVAAIYFMLTKIELTEEEIERTDSLKVSHALELAKNSQFWMLLLFTLFVTQIYDTYDQQFAQYFSMQFPTQEEGNHWYGILASVQVCGETLFLCLMPWFVNRTGAKWALVIAGTIMSLRIVGSAVQLGPVWIAAVKMMHAVEKPLILVSIFKFIAANFDNKLSSTVYLLVLFVASIATTIYSPVAGYLYDTIGFAETYLILGSVAGFFTLVSVFTLREGRADNAITQPSTDSVTG
ncbi:oligosaccharide MFS transporter [Salmonella enterica]|nr:MFS transporter [Salmonella enterica]EBR3855262.1 MFS transporter [Salmonella enterica subsp. enterica]ECH9401899.1 MFS transporter [Salmonella enterica subsp. diarizonae]ECT9718292.1 MFS transporter [Salmonella enterica subsp. diarizonae str. CFSAN000553]EGE4753552.1 oligosaccharide MFS transporter [Salmonella enterica subsp. diarizonae serovar 38:[k]:z35]SUG62502.1 galactoside permease [Salmonella enterica subsp. arizonae]HAF0277331.1 oligosaccharide MFS transporter [Salmonella enterica 